MRKVEKDVTAVPAVLVSDDCEALIADALVKQGKHDFKTAIYGHPQVRLALIGIYHTKCAFCETDTSAGAPLQVEHYRPKAKVIGLPIHPGYYWLGYEWSNLVLACASCNRSKGNHFPITGTRVTIAPLNGGVLDRTQCRINAIELGAEEPLLVNPEVDANPMRHFRFQADGQIEDKTLQGANSIRIYRLNRASLIVKRRKYVYDPIFNKQLKHFDKFQRGSISAARLHHLLVATIEELIDYINDEENQYLEFAKTCWQEFDSFFLARFQVQEQSRLQVAYDEVIYILENL